MLIPKKSVGMQWYAITFAVYFMFLHNSAVVSHDYLTISTVCFLLVWVLFGFLFPFVFLLVNPTDSCAMKPETAWQYFSLY